jgi:xanthine dehydrogenase accessory factor
MRRETLARLNEARRDGRAVVRAVDMGSGEERLIDPASDSSTLGQAAAAAARADRSGPTEIEGRSWFLAVYNPPLELVIVGAVHIAQPLSAMARMTGYDVKIVDPRERFASADRFPDMTLIHAWPEEDSLRALLKPRSALVALTHDPKLDDPALLAALKSPCFYIGALGSKKNHANRLARLKAQGFDDAQLARIHGPIGLAIGARSPEEIAISILAEMTAELRLGESQSAPAIMPSR